MKQTLSSRHEGVTVLDQALSACTLALVYALIFGFFSNVLMLALPLYSLQVLDRVISSGSMETLLMLTLVVLGSLVALQLIQTFRGFALNRTGEWLERKISPILFSHTISGAVHGKPVGGSQHLRDLSTIKGFICGTALTSIIDAPWAVIFIAVLYLIHPANGIVVLLGGGVLFFLAFLNEKATKANFEAAGRQAIQSMQQVDAATRNAEVIEGMGMQRNITAAWQQTNEKAMALNMLATNHASVFGNISKFLRFALQVGVTGIGGYLVLHSEMTTGGMIASSILAGRALAPFESSILSWKGVISARASYHRLNESLARAANRFEAMQLPKPQGKLDVESISFVPLGQRVPTLKNVSFSLNPGEIMGLIGPSAAGKSTLAKVLLGVWKAASGAARLDGADVYQWNRADFGNHVGYLPQDVELFSGTVKDNIARMDTGADPQAVVAAAQFAGVHEVILHLSNGYDTEIGDAGATLSAGQRQRIGLARAFYGTPKLVILDEPNANLDQEGDVALAYTLQKAKQAKITTIVISHRPSVMEQVDKILVLKDGAVVSFNDRKTVLEQLAPKKLEKVS